MGLYATESLKLTILLIIDECTMASKHMTIVIDKPLKEVMTENVYEKNKISFGGKAIIFRDYLRQCLPAQKHRTRVDILEQCIVKSLL